MENNELLTSLKEKFEQIKKEFNFKSTFSEIENIFFISDFILKEGFVSTHLERQISGRIIDTYNSWAGYLHNFIIPNPGNVVSVMENKVLSEREKKDIGDLFKKCMVLSSWNTIIGLTRNKQEQALFIDEAVRFWNEEFRGNLTEILNKLNENWKK